MTKTIVLRQVAAAITICMVLCTLTGCFLQSEIVIKQGFSQTLIDRLREDYNITIPDSAEFVEGTIYHSFRDPSMYVTFIIPKDDLEGILGDDWELYSKNKDTEGTTCYHYQRHFEGGKKKASMEVKEIWWTDKYKVFFDGSAPNSEGIQ